MKKYLLYHFRWQTGAIITIPAMYLFIDIMNLSTWIAVIFMQFVGAIVFYPIDQYIFKKKEPLCIHCTNTTICEICRNKKLTQLQNLLDLK